MTTCAPRTCPVHGRPRYVRPEYGDWFRQYGSTRPTQLTTVRAGIISARDRVEPCKFDSSAKNCRPVTEEANCSTKKKAGDG
jgi:hypothetical protein